MDGSVPLAVQRDPDSIEPTRKECDLEEDRPTEIDEGYPRGMMAHRVGLLVLWVAACSPAAAPSAVTTPAAPEAAGSSAALSSAALSSAALSSAALSSAISAQPPLAELPNIDTGAALTHIRTLASDEFEGRAPGTPGEERTVQYLIDQFGAAGLAPGNPDGTWIQTVPLLGILPSQFTPLSVTRDGKAQSFAHGSEVVAFSQRGVEAIRLAGSELVFVGYGVQAPEYGWDDFKGLDVKGKTLVMLVNDPPVAAADGSGLDPQLFGGKAMTLYGRWTYKYEKAAELGAAGVFIVHETEAAGYPFKVVQGFGGERFDLVTPDKNLGRAAVQGWLSLEAATRLFQLAGQDYQKLKSTAASRAFQPVGLGMAASMSFRQALRPVSSKNVIAKLEGSDPALARETVIYTAHWDHLGIGTARNGDAIYNGAADNASGSAALIEIARALSHAPRPKRTLLFLATTAEEQGLLGSRYYAQFPLYPLTSTLANINADNNLPMWGRTRDVIVIGLGASDLDDYLRAAAAEQNQTLSPDAEPEKGFYYRSDHFNFAKAGVPALSVGDGIDYVGKPAGFGQQKQAEYLANDYHSPSDQIKPDWDLAGFAEQAKLLLAVGYRVAQSSGFPEWKPGNEFRKIREDSLKER
jgi:Zn-dependent M28 family amino/carboxypeptidase